MLEVYIYVNKYENQIIESNIETAKRTKKREREIDALPLMHSLTCPLDIQIPAEKVF